MVGVGGDAVWCGGQGPIADMLAQGLVSVMKQAPARLVGHGSL